jgi:hypothetical protein
VLTAYLADSGLRAVMAPDVPMQMSPLAEPGNFRPSPVSEVTVAVKASPVGLKLAVLE